jgi:hypothetical protein
VSEQRTKTDGAADGEPIYDAVPVFEPLLDCLPRLDLPRRAAAQPTGGLEPETWRAVGAWLQTGWPHFILGALAAAALIGLLDRHRNQERGL